MTIYLDNNATTQPFDEVVDTVARAMRESYGNPGSPHAPGRAARRVLEEARESLAANLGAAPSEVVFTSGGTESSNLALFGLARGDRRTILLTEGEHPATLRPCRQLEAAGWKLEFLPVDGQGLLVQDRLDEIAWDEVGLATCILAHNETGVIQWLEPLAALCNEHRVPLHVDAVQAVGKIPVDFRDLGATTLSLGAHKFHGPRGIGALIVRERTTLQARNWGGFQEDSRRAGTEPVALAAGMSHALQLCVGDLEERASKLQSLRDRLENGLLTTCGPAVVNGGNAPRLPNTSNIGFPGLDGEALIVALDLAGIACSFGSACASGSPEPSPALVAMNCDEQIYRSSLRFSVSTFNTAHEVDEAVERIAEIVQRLRTAN